MSIFTTTFEAVATLLFIGTVGFYVIRRKVLPENAMHILVIVAVNIALPATIFANIVTTFKPEKMPDWWRLPMYFLLFSLLSFLVSKILTFLFKSRYKNEFTASLFFQNAVFFPLAIIAGGNFGSHMLVDLFLFTLLFSSLYFSTIGLFFNAKTNAAEKIKIFNAPLIATVIGAGSVLIGFDVFIPDFVVSGFELVGNMSTPLLMLVLGGSMYFDFQNKGKPEFAEVAKFLLAKNIIYPALAILIISIWKPAHDIALLILIQAAVPPITSLSVMAVRYDGSRKIINQFILSSFVLSLITIPLFVMLLGQLYKA